MERYLALVEITRFYAYLLDFEVLEQLIVHLGSGHVFCVVAGGFLRGRWFALLFLRDVFVFI